MPLLRRTRWSMFLLIQQLQRQKRFELMWSIIIVNLISKRRKHFKRGRPIRTYDLISRMPTQVKRMSRLVGVNDFDCIDNIRMDRNTFGRLCILLRELGGLVDGRYVTVEEQLAMFLGLIAHHKKNKVVCFDFWRSGQTVSHYVHLVLEAILKLNQLFLVRPEAVPEDSEDPRWKWFKGCLGALDGTYINVMVGSMDKPRYRTRKGQIATNTLAACDTKLRFVYVLPGWEGSAGDSRVLRDALDRPHGLRVPRGNYYLCDNGYANSDGFLTPYKGVRYHLKDWGPEAGRPQNAQELFNMRHTNARNVIERAFGVMKMRWGILRSASYYPIKIQTRLIMACFLLHNFIRSEMEKDPMEDQIEHGVPVNESEEEHPDIDYVDGVEPSHEWNATREQLAQMMWNQENGLRTT